MAKRATILPVGILPAILLCAAATSGLTLGAFAPAALAQDNETSVNQVQLGDVFSGQTLNVYEAPNGTNAATTAIGNAATGVGSGAPMNYQAYQDLNANVHAATTVNVAGDSGSGLYVVTSATGNTGTAGTCCAGTTGAVTQRVEGYNAVLAESHVNMGGGADEVAVSSAAVGNTQGWETVNGSVNAATAQSQLGSTEAITSGNVASAGEAGYAATAVANNVTTDATASPSDQTVYQGAVGFDTTANASVSQGDGNDIAVAATATANNVNLTNDSYSSSLTLDQASGKTLTASANLAVDTWYGSASVSAYGVANSAIVSSSGPYTEINAQQSSTGPITVTANLTGGAGGDALASATGVGNALSGYACATCNGTVHANAAQTNSGGVQSNATVNVGSVNSATGIATSIGNTATFAVQKPGG